MYLGVEGSVRLQDNPVHDAVLPPWRAARGRVRPLRERVGQQRSAGAQQSHRRQGVVAKVQQDVPGADVSGVGDQQHPCPRGRSRGHVRLQHHLRDGAERRQRPSGHLLRAILLLFGTVLRQPGMEQVRYRDIPAVELKFNKCA